MNLVQKHHGAAILKVGHSYEEKSFSPGPGKYNVKLDGFKTSYSF